MREFESTFREGLKKGLRKHHDNPRNVEGLVKCLNTKPSEGGPIPIVPVTYPITDVLGTLSWPHPQVFDVVTPAQPAKGAIDALIDTLEYDTTSGTTQALVHLADDMYAVFYKYATGAQPAKVATFEVDSDGDISTLIDSGTIMAGILDATDEIKAVKIREENGSHIIAFMYNTTVLNVNVGLFSITTDGTINTTALDTLQIVNSDDAPQDILKVHGSLFLTFHAGPSIDSIAIGASYAMSKVDSLATLGTQGQMIHVTRDIYALVCQHTDTDGFVYTFEVDHNGNIGSAHIDSLEFDTSSCYDPRIILISDDLYAVVYRDASNDGWIKTFRIGSDGYISSAVIDSYEFSTECVAPEVCLVGGRVIAIAFTEYSTNDGFLKTFYIDSDGDIRAAALDSLEFDTTQALFPEVHYLGDNIIAVNYSDSYGDGRIRTIGLTTL